MNQWKNLLKSASFLIVFSILVFLSWSGKVSNIFGIFAGLILFFKIASWWRHFFDKIFDIPLVSFQAWIFSWFWTLVSIGALAGVGLFFGRLDALAGSVSFLVGGLVALFFNQYNFIRIEPVKDVKVEVKEERALDKILVLVYLVLFFVGINILVHAQTGASILTPWQVIPANFILIYFLATVVLMRMFFSELPTRAILALIIFHTFLTVSYLPFTHELLYGADIWRHLAIENSFIQNGGWRDVAVTGAKAIFDWGKLSYAQFLSVGVILNRVFGLDLILVGKWLQPVLWAFLFPTLLFSFSRELGTNKRMGLLVALFGFLPFALQVAGAFTLPVNFGFLVWLFLVLLLLKFARERLKVQAIFLILFGILLVFGYSSYFILFWLLWFVLEGAHLANDWSRGKKFLVSIVLFFTTALVVPVFELVANFSHWSSNLNILSGVKQFVGNLSGWYLAFGPRPHDIMTGNILFNQIPSTVFIPNFLTVDRYWLIIAAVVFWLAVLFGVLKSLRAKDFRIKSLALMTIGLFIGYFVCRYFLIGENSLSRRLDIVLAFLSIFFGAQFWLGVFLKKKDFFIRFRYWLVLIAVIFVSSVATASYSLGPDTQTVSVSERQAAQYIWQQVSTDNKFCVLGDTYSLFPLEVESAKRIVGGGFPINVNYGQPERLQLLSDLATHNVANVLTDAKKVTGANRCWLVVDEKLVKNGKNILRTRFNNILIFSF